MQPAVQSFFHPPTWTITHVVRDPDSTACAIVDPVLDFDIKSGRTATVYGRGSQTASSMSFDTRRLDC